MKYEKWCDMVWYDEQMIWKNMYGMMYSYDPIMVSSNANSININADANNEIDKMSYHPKEPCCICICICICIFIHIQQLDNFEPGITISRTIFKRLKAFKCNFKLQWVSERCRIIQHSLSLQYNTFN